MQTRYDATAIAAGCSLYTSHRDTQQQQQQQHQQREYLLWKYCVTFIRNVHFVYLIGLSALCIRHWQCHVFVCVCVCECECVLSFFYSQWISCSCSDNFCEWNATDTGTVEQGETKRERERVACLCPSRYLPVGVCTFVRVRMLLAILCLNLL